MDMVSDVAGGSHATAAPAVHSAERVFLGGWGHPCGGNVQSRLGADGHGEWCRVGRARLAWHRGRVRPRRGLGGDGRQRALPTAPQPGAGGHHPQTVECARGWHGGVYTARHEAVLLQRRTAHACPVPQSAHMDGRLHGLVRMRCRYVPKAALGSRGGQCWPLGRPSAQLPCIPVGSWWHPSAAAP